MSSNAPEGAFRVLLVDDEDALRAAMARYLEREGHAVVQAENGAAAVAALDRDRFDAVVSDISMPDLDGIGLLRAVRDRDLDLPVLLATGAPSVRTAADAVTLGALTYLLKPVDLAELEERTRKAATLYRLARVKRAMLDLTGSGGPSDRAGLEASYERAVSGLWTALQPILTRERTLFGYEALMRSKEPALPHPGAVLDAAERLGDLRRLGRIVRQRTVDAFVGADPDSQLFVNLHPDDLADEVLYDASTGLANCAHRVVLEVTERASLRNVKDVPGCVSRLRDLGYRIAVDDLGAGYAGLTSFTDLEPEIVKLDMSLVRGVGESATKQKLIRSMTSLCHDLGVGVVAEGVETVRERDCLLELGADYLQGYLFAKPAAPFTPWTWGDR